eukprot:CCRYP_020779-RA/>CCRYP_020779-RA protein AED:0.27 eAED:1.00 QI:0/-1/0/1/-1/0/1/0/89
MSSISFFNYWLRPNKLLAILLAVKLLNSNLPPRLLEEAPLQQESLKSFIVIVLALLHSVKSAPTQKKHRSSYPQGAIPAPCKGSSAGFK